MRGRCVYGDDIACLRHDARRRLCAHLGESESAAANKHCTEHCRRAQSVGGWGVGAPARITARPPAPVAAGERVWLEGSAAGGPTGGPGGRADGCAVAAIVAATEATHFDLRPAARRRTGASERGADGPARPRGAVTSGIAAAGPARPCPKAVEERISIGIL